tara:strand:+ start:19177 stop:19899 length:723 start_codon:yes stop_codon:yes gene_type:complete
MDLSQATSDDAKNTTSKIVVFPVGSTEQHGPHAPLSTDLLLATSIAEEGIKQSTHEVILAPPLPFGVSEEHRNFSGTIWLSPSTFRNCIKDVLNSFIYHGWDKIIIVNGHGGNIDALNEVCAEVTRNTTTPAFATTFTWFLYSNDIPMGHAGEVETSLLLCQFPDLVDHDMIEEATINSGDSWGSNEQSAQMKYDVDQFSRNGVIGDPSAASEQFGRKLLNESGISLAKLIDTVSKIDVS